MHGSFHDAVAQQRVEFASDCVSDAGVNPDIRVALRLLTARAAGTHGIETGAAFSRAHTR